MGIKTNVGEEGIPLEVKVFNMECERKKLVVLFLCLLFGFCRGVEEDEGQENIRMIQETLKSLNFYIRLQLDEMNSYQATVYSNFEDLRERLDGLTKTQKTLQEKVEEMDGKSTTKLTELKGGQELLRGQLVKLNESSILERDQQRDFWNQSCNADHVTELQTNSSTDTCVSPSHFMPSLGCIIPVTKGMNWEDARHNCIQQGGRLLQEITYDELQQLDEHFRSLLLSSGYGARVWLGITGGKWVEGGDPIINDPSSSSPIWEASGEPDDGHAACGFAFLDSSPSLYDTVSCHHTFYSLCQRK